tara:strand:- start:14 stop:190 length:177 start_codon:yes stop_codon:yes gene_type:complete
MDHNIAQDYVNYRIGEGWTLLQIAMLHKLPVQLMERPSFYSEDFIVDRLAREHAQLNR